MSQKRAIRYLRISTDRQSNFSIDGQDMQTRHWCDRHDVEIIDTFVDEGYSARNFDRPDMKRLNDFIEKHYRTVDYLVVNAFDRFSRQAGEAIVAIKILQKKFAVKVVSVSEGVTFDADDPGSFFYAGLMLLKGEDEIIRNRGRINLGIYTAKKKEGRYLGTAPFGYSNSRDDNNKPTIVINQETAPIIRYIYSAFAAGVTFKEIGKKAREMGYAYTSHSYIQQMLKNPTYTGLLHVKAYKENPEELVEGVHEAIITRTTWLEVQDKMSARSKGAVQVISDEFPLRSVLKCHCGLPVTGAPSRGRAGKYYNYYKCKVTGHNNISASMAHEQLTEVFRYMSMSDRLIAGIKESSEKIFEQRMKENTRQLKTKSTELEDAETKLRSVEEKWICNQMSFDTYQRWFTDLTQKRMSLNAQIETLSQSQDELYMLLQKELGKLGDMRGLYTSATTIQKQQLVKIVFDSQLYYKDRIYRTGYVMPVFSDNLLILKEKKLLLLDEKRGLLKKVPLGGPEQFSIEHLKLILTLTQSIKAAS